MKGTTSLTTYLRLRVVLLAVLVGCCAVLSQAPYDDKKYEYASPPGYAGSPTSNECKYDNVHFSDCDPFTLSKYRTKTLLAGGQYCEKTKNETEQCSPDDFPPGTQWLVKEHKKCISELEHLKSLIADLHRWIDLIAERGHALYGAFGELRKHLEEIQKKISYNHRMNHDNEVAIERLNKELEQWKEKARALRAEVDKLKAQYAQLQREHDVMKKELESCEKDKESCSKETAEMNDNIDRMEIENRQLKGQILDAERYKQMVEKATDNLHQLKEMEKKLQQQINNGKYEAQKCHADLLNAKNRKGPKLDKDTHVNLDMQMWITHNQTEYPQSSTYPPPPPPPEVYPQQKIYVEPEYSTPPPPPPPSLPPPTYYTDPPTTTTTYYPPPPPPEPTQPPYYPPPPPPYTQPPPPPPNPYTPAPYTAPPPETYELPEYKPPAYEETSAAYSPAAPQYSPDEYKAPEYSTPASDKY